MGGNSSVTQKTIVRKNGGGKFALRTERTRLKVTSCSMKYLIIIKPFLLNPKTNSFSGRACESQLWILSVWKDISMDFIIELPVYKGLSVNFVVVDRFTKYAHFVALPTRFNAPKVADIFIYLVVKFHGIPKIIVSDHDPIFVSHFWKQLFDDSGTKLNHSMTYDPQSDGQAEVVNCGLEQYLRAMVSDRPQQWVRLLLWAKYSYNTSFHSSIKMTPYQAVYGRIPPMIVHYPIGSSKVAVVGTFSYVDLLIVGKVKESLEKHQPHSPGGSDIEFSKAEEVVPASSGDPSVLEGYTDASWIADQEDYASTSGWIFTLGGGAVS
nr:Ty3/gypsy retrotransposon protein [Tanacetum cinerariifolium]